MPLNMRDTIITQLINGQRDLNVGNAAGLCKALDGKLGAEHLSRLLEPGSNITFGSYRRHQFDGNPPPNEFYDPTTGIGGNSKGIPTSMDFEVFCLTELPEMIDCARAAGHTATVSVNSGDLDELVEMAEMAIGAGVDFVEINTACPNKVDGKQMLCYRQDELDVLGVKLETSGLSADEIGRVGLKLGIYSDPTLIPTIAHATSWCRRLVMVNTFANSGFALPDGEFAICTGPEGKIVLGGGSGTMLKPIMLGHIYQFDGLTGADLTAVGGIKTVDDVVDAYIFGADGVQIGTDLYFPAQHDTPLRIREELAERYAAIQASPEA